MPLYQIVYLLTIIGTYVFTYFLNLKSSFFLLTYKQIIINTARPRHPCKGFSNPYAIIINGISNTLTIALSVSLPAIKCAIGGEFL